MVTKKGDTKFKKIGISAISRKENILNCTSKLIRFLVKSGYEVIIEDNLMNSLGGCEEKYTVKIDNLENQAKYCDLMLALGGDGNMMRVSRQIILQPNKSVIGINFGRVGFLTDLQADRVIESLQEILDGNYKFCDKPILQADFFNYEGQKQATCYAINDVVLRGVNADMIETEISIQSKPEDENLYEGKKVDNKRYDYSYIDRSDGVIVSTPTGSTAYALSAGGTIIHPNLKATLIVPICSHILTSRPMVIPFNLKINLSTGLEDRQAFWQIDGQNYPDNLKKGDYLCISVIEKGVRFLQPNSYNFFDKCRTNMNWGT